jgi:hypothetical protein
MCKLCCDATAYGSNRRAHASPHTKPITISYQIANISPYDGTYWNANI